MNTLTMKFKAHQRHVFSRAVAGLIEQRMIVVGVMVIKVNLVC